MSYKREQYDFLQSVVSERGRQDQEWGGPKHDDEHTYVDWLQFIRHQLDSILIIDGGRERHEEAMRDPANLTKFRERMVKVAALASAAVESTERKAKKK